MSWVKTYIPDEKKIQAEHKAYLACLSAERAKIKKSNKLVRKDYTNN